MSLPEELFSTHFAVIDAYDDIEKLKTAVRQTDLIVFRDLQHNLLSVDTAAQIRKKLEEGIIEKFFFRFLSLEAKPAMMQEKGQDTLLPYDYALISVDNGDITGVCFQVPMSSGMVFSGMEPIFETRGRHKAPGPAGKKLSRNPGKKAGAKKPFFLNARYPEETFLKEPFELVINLSENQEQAAAIPMMVDKAGSVDILVQPVCGFQVNGESQCDLIPGGGDSAQFTFSLLPVAAGDGKIRIYAFQEGQPLGNMTINLKVAEKKKDSRQREQQQQMEPTNLRMPDLLLMILEHTAPNGDTHISYVLSAADSRLKIYLKRYGPVVLRSDPARYMNGLYQQLETLALEAGSPDVASKLESFGAGLYEELVPHEMKQLLWSVKDKITTIKIDSDEPWIPWELCRMTGEENGSIVEAGFLAELFEVTRWIPDHQAPVPVLEVKKMAVVAPDSDLSFPKKEKAFLKKLAGKQFELEQVPARYADIRELMKSGTISIWHFTGHGRNPDLTDPSRPEMVLEGGETFTPDLLTGSVLNMGRTRPIVFLNACQLGKTGLSLTGIGGWAPRFLKAGASVFIGAYWSVTDDAAFEFARTFYNLLLQDNWSVGAAAFAARKAIRDKGDPTWMAYTVYADPYAVVSKMV